ncbi:MAG: type II toxin-antitoxin system RelB/DinJ family antitoxin [Propionibacteriaceae bacterium]|nr:type II toxin-antitoxin system RelB/DinJ family antitoxin [Propionibacteriaceae bacterium]
MKSALVQVRVDDEVKHEVDTLFAELGLDTATAIRIFFMQALQRHGLPFSVEKLPNAATEQAMRDVNNQHDMHGPFASVDELMESALHG